MNDPTTRLAAFKESAPTAFSSPPFAEIEAAGHRRRVRTTLTAVAAAVIVLAVIVVAAGSRLGHRPEVGTTPTPSPSAVAPQGLDVRGKLTVDLPEWKYAPDNAKPHPDCARHGPVHFPATWGYSLVSPAADPSMILGELRGLTGAAQLVVVHCKGEPGKADDSGEFAVLLATPTGPDALRGLGYLASWGPNRIFAGVGFTDGGDAYVDLSDGQVVQRRVYRWTGIQVTQVAGGTAFASPARVKAIDPASFWYFVPVSAAVFTGLCGWAELGGPDGVALVDGTGATLVRRDNNQCLPMTARLAYTTRGTIQGAGEVVLVTVAFDVAGQPRAVAYALYDWDGALQVKVLNLEPPVVAVDGQRITGNRLEVTARTASGPATYRWRVQVIDANGFPEAQFVPVS